MAISGKAISRRPLLVFGGLKASPARVCSSEREIVMTPRVEIDRAPSQRQQFTASWASGGSARMAIGSNQCPCKASSTGAISSAFSASTSTSSTFGGAIALATLRAIQLALQG